MIQVENAVFKGSKAVPVLLLLDVSGSMTDDRGAKIDNLNKAVTEMIDFLKKDAARTESFYIVGIITFGGDKANKFLPFTDANKITWKPMIAAGGTPLGQAFKMAKDMIEAKEDKAVTGRSYVPTVVLVSDGRPNTDGIWEKALDAFIGEGRTQKCDRWAMGIGSDAVEKMLRRFAKPKEKPNDPEKYVHGAASEIVQFFQKVSSVVSLTGKNIQQGPVLKGGLGGGKTVKKNPDDESPV